MGTGSGSGLIVIVLLVIYFLPTIIGRNHHNAGAIFALNILLGWTFVGWVVALVWSLTESKSGSGPDYSVDDRELRRNIRR